MPGSSRPSRGTRRVAGISATVATAITLAALGAQPASAIGVTPQPYCPPATQTVGTHLSERLYNPDTSPGHFIPSVVAGTLPPGASLFDGSWYSNYQAAPTTAGSYDFSIKLTAGSGGLAATSACHVDVTDELDLSGLETQRIGGADRYDASAAMSSAMAYSRPGTVYIASGEVFADALSASAIAAQQGVPLLLTTYSRVPNAIAAELSRLRPLKVVILGGTDSISPAVETQLNLYADKVERISGSDRFEASRAIIQAAAAPSTSLYVASGNVFADALSAAPAASAFKAPVLLVDGNQPALGSAEADLFSVRGVKRAIIVGGPSTVSVAMESDIRMVARQVKRLDGADRYDASAAIARDAFPASASTRPTKVYLSTGERYPDALSGAPLAASTGSPIYLAHSDCIPRDTARHILDIGATKVVLLGGLDSLNQDVADLKVCTA